ncbi:hypothetical protein HQH22_25040, partial [Escherichia coli]|nr:hypothetical protein [Escherichia coli]
MHISELLQEAGTQLESEHALVRWLSQHILSQTVMPPANKCVSKVINIWCRIVTIHKSKGLEYPLVWLPFITNFRVQDQAFLSRSPLVLRQFWILTSASRKRRPRGGRT